MALFCESLVSCNRYQHSYSVVASFESVESAESCIMWLRQFSDVHPSFARVSGQIATCTSLFDIETNG